MSEEGLDARPREVWQEREFGHDVVQTYLGEVYYLDLYQTYQTPDTILPAFVCRGYCLPPTRSRLKTEPTRFGRLTP